MVSYAPHETSFPRVVTITVSSFHLRKLLLYLFVQIQANRYGMVDGDYVSTGSIQYNVIAYLSYSIASFLSETIDYL